MFSVAVSLGLCDIPITGKAELHDKEHYLDAGLVILYKDFRIAFGKGAFTWKMVLFPFLSAQFKFPLIKTANLGPRIN